MTDSLIPKPFGITDARRRQEEEARRREQATSARNTSSTTIGAGGRLDVDGGDLDIFNGGNAVVRDGGSFRVEGGGSMEVVDDGEVTVHGQGKDWTTKELTDVRASLGNRLAFNQWLGLPYLQPGVYFNAGESRGALDPRLVSEDGVGLNMVSSAETLTLGPHVGPNIKSSSNSRIGPEAASIGSGAWDDVVNPGGGDGLNGLKGQSYGYFAPHEMILGIDNYDLTTTPTIPPGPAVTISGTLEEGVLRLFGRGGVDISGPLTVDGAPISTTTLWANIPDKPSTFPPSTHSHPAATVSAAGFMSTADKVKLDDAAVIATPGTLARRNSGGQIQVASPGSAPDAANRGYVDAADAALQTAINDKASKAVATSTTAGLMPGTDKAKLDGATPNPTANRLVYRDVWGRAKIADPVATDDIATKGYVDTAVLSPVVAMTELAYAGGYGPYNAASFASPGYYSDRERVYMGGLLGIAGASISMVLGGIYTVGNLPLGYRPSKDILVKSLVGPSVHQSMFMYVRAGGQIQIYSPSSTTYAKNDFFVSFENISFRI